MILIAGQTQLSQKEAEKQIQNQENGYERISREGVIPF